jgi:hypothetical protein
MRPASDERLRKVIGMGKSRFVWVNGVLSWGVPMALTMTIFESIPYHGIRDVALSFAISAPIGLIGGYLWGRWVWHGYEKRYADLPPA